MTTIEQLHAIAVRLDHIFHDDVCDCGDPDTHGIRKANVGMAERALRGAGVTALLDVAEAAQECIDWMEGTQRPDRNDGESRFARLSDALKKIPQEAQ